MITVASQVLKNDNWNGTSTNSTTQETQQNLDSSMGWAEHQRIVVEARALLQGNIGTGSGDADARFKALQQTFNEDTPGIVVEITKGIHQTISDAHVQLRLVKETERNTKGAGTTFHLNVQPTDKGALVGIGDGYFHWKGSQFKCWVGETAYFWPSPEIRGWRQRRNSISAAGLADHVVAVAKEEARLAADAEFQSKWDKWKALPANQDLVIPLGPQGVKGLRKTGEMTCKTKGKIPGQAKVTWANGGFVRSKI
jgi:hypothetical protein